MSFSTNENYNEAMKDPKKTVVVWDDIDFVARWWGWPWAMNFEVFQINARECTKLVDGVMVSDGTKGLPDEGKGMCVLKKNASNGCDFAETLEDAAVFVEGFVKWDGCSHVQYPETEHCMIHLCGEHSWAAWAELHKRIIKLAEAIPHWDGESAR